MAHPLDVLRYHVTGAIERGEAAPIVGQAHDDKAKEGTEMTIREADLETAFLAGQEAYREGMTLPEAEREAWADDEMRRHFIAGWRLIFESDLAR